MNNTVKTYTIKAKNGNSAEVTFYESDYWKCTCSYFQYQQSNRRMIECCHVKRARVLYQIDIKGEYAEPIMRDGKKIGNLIIL